MTLPLVGLGFLSLSWEILSAMYRCVTGSVPPAGPRSSAMTAEQERGSWCGWPGATPEGVIRARRDAWILWALGELVWGAWSQAEGWTLGLCGVGAQFGGAG